MEPDYQDKGFVLFLLGAGLVLLMYKIALIIESSDKRVVDTYEFAALMDKLKEYISHGNDTLQKIDGEIATRLGQITEPQRASQTLVNPGSGGVSVSYYWWWQDTGDGSAPAGLSRYRHRRMQQHHGAAPGRCAARPRCPLHTGSGTALFAILRWRPRQSTRHGRQMAGYADGVRPVPPAIKLSSCGR